MAAVQFIILCLVATYTTVVECQCVDEPGCKYCTNGWYGPDCDLRCPTNCEGASGCHRSTGQCDHACALNYWGNFCELPCPSNCRQGCNQSSSKCHGGCSPEWYGTFCNMSCPKDCMTCIRLTGRCIKTKVPPVTMVATEAAPLTYRRTGRLNAGASRCKTVWRAGQWVNDCSAGCEVGWRGSRCDQRCPDECYSCSRYPDSQLCIYGKEVVAVHTYGSDYDETDGLGMRTIYALLHVIPPFLIVGIVLFFNVCWERFN